MAQEIQMMQAMGIPFTFDSTTGKHVSKGGDGALLRGGEGPSLLKKMRSVLTVPALAFGCVRVHFHELARTASQVEDEAANASASRIKTKRTARQFMNRRGGFNRPLPTEKTNEKVLRD